MTVNIAVIGSGNVGSRHVQGLASSVAKMNVFVTDLKKNNLEKTKKLILENNLDNNKNINISFNQTISKINNSIDLAIISTNSDVRRQVIEKLVSLNDVKNIILEKIAFQNIDDFDFIIKLLDRKKIKSYINFQRRFCKSYHNLKKEISKEKKIYISVVGRDWGLVSNTLHMLDLFAYLTNTKKISIKEVSLNNKIYDSHRKGFVELKGTLIFSSDRGDILRLCDFDQYKKNISFLGVKYRGIIFGGIRIENKNFSYSIYENYQKIVKIVYNKNLLVDVDNFEVPLQSVLTKYVADDFFKKNKIYLPRLKDSYHHHKIIFDIFTNHINKCDINLSGCPIT